MTPKYRGEQNPALHGGHLYWPGGPRGFPVRATPGQRAPMLKQEEYRNLQVSLDFHCASFNTWDPTSTGKYRELMDRIANRQFLLRFQDRRYDEAKQGWWFWVEWIQPYETMPA